MRPNAYHADLYISNTKDIMTLLSTHVTTQFRIYSWKNEQKAALIRSLERSSTAFDSR